MNSRQALHGARFLDMDDECTGMRMVKTAEKIALTQRAMNYGALGDDTVLVEGMMFSNEPGLYDPEHGFGYNHSDNVLVTKTKGVQMGSAPFTKAWCFVTL